MSDTQEVEKPIVVTESEGGEAVFEVPTAEPPKGDARLGRTEEQRDDDEGGGSGGESSEDRRSRNARRRAAQRAARERNESSVAQLSQIVTSQQRMIEALAHGQRQNALSTLQREAEDAKAAYAEAQARHAKAVEAGDGNLATEALRVMQNASAHYQLVAGQYNGIVRQMSAAEGDREGDGERPQGAPPRRQTQQAPQLSREDVETIEEKRDAFLERHGIDLSKENARTIAIKAIDGTVARDGFTPNTDDYWDELRDRLKEANLLNDTAPRRRASDDDDRSPPTSGAGRNGARGGTTVVLTAEMRKALSDASIPLVGGDADTVRRRNRILSAWAEKR